jgi:tellurite resistance protein
MTTPAETSPEPSLDAAKAFAAVALAAVSWDGVLTVAGTRTLRHALDYRAPFDGSSDDQMIALMDELLHALRQRGAEGLMQEAARALDRRQRHTAYAVAVEIMRSDGPLSEKEESILANLAATLELPEEETAKVLEVMDVLHASVLSPVMSA